MARPRLTLPNTLSFNEVVTLDLKEFGTKYVLWMIDRFSRFIVGKLLNNKKAETVIQALMGHWCMSVVFPSYGFYADNGGEFRNFKMHEFVSKIGIKIEFSLFYLLWSNGLKDDEFCLTGMDVR